MPKKDASFGRSLMKDHKRRHRIAADGYRHSCDLMDEADVGNLNLKSVTEQTALQDFLDLTALAENEHEHKSDVKIIDPAFLGGVLSEEEKALVSSIQDQNKEFICIPRRPEWDESTSKEVLIATERESFLIWRRRLAELQDVEHIHLTPFEKNLEIWRQLWRVIERSDVVVQIIDSRNPLLFQCPDLERYVKEVDESKTNVLLMNKADFLTESQRKSWCEYFEAVGIQVVFFSALEETQREDDSTGPAIGSNGAADISKVTNRPDVLSREELVAFFGSLCKGKELIGDLPTIGLVGYPNVGKSSTVNALLMCKKVSVSATPGKTKHFQTHIINDDLVLCDCPGLVFPNFVSTKADMVVNGILPIDQLTECVGPVTLIAQLIPRRILQSAYSLLIPCKEENDPNAPPTAEELLNAHGYNRGYMTQRGMPDNSRSARYILKDFVNGKLLYCHAPPGVNQEEFHKFPEVKPRKAVAEVLEYAMDEDTKVLTKADKKFFTKSHEVHMKGHTMTREQLIEAGAKPWKKHHNKNKKEKTRLLYRNPYDMD